MTKKKCEHPHIDPMSGLNGDCYCFHCGELIHRGVKNTGNVHPLIERIDIESELTKVNCPESMLVALSITLIQRKLNEIIDFLNNG